MRKKLLIISHTEHYYKNGIIVGWGSTVTEINYLSQYWKDIVHIACLHNAEAPGSSLPYTSANIRFVPISPFGGNTFIDKLGILIKIPEILRKVSTELKDATEVQLRLPTGIGVILLPWFSIRKRSYIFWVKYAGNWQEESPPMGYAFQRWWLKKNFSRCKVTINGQWPDQLKHCKSFENPCLYRDELEFGKEVTEIKLFEPPYTLIFIGRLEDAKGVMRILEALKQIAYHNVKKVHFVGDSDKKVLYQDIAAKINIPIHFHSFLSRSSIHHLLQNADFLLLPSTASEGFPKVIAEGACYGVIPIVSNIASIPQYVNPNNGFLWIPDMSLFELLNYVLMLKPDHLRMQSKELSNLALKFGFDAYYKKLEKEVLIHER